MHEISASSLREKLLKPAADIRSILRWGYPKFATIRFVADHAGLDARERQILTRVVLPPDKTVSRAKKKLDCERIGGKPLLIDGYNVLLSVDSLLKGESMWLCDDSFIRDTRFYFGKAKHAGGMEEALEELLSFLNETGPKSVTFLLDSQISRSGELAGIIRNRLNEKGITGEARTSKHVDFDLKTAGKFTWKKNEESTGRSARENIGKNSEKYTGESPVIATSDGIIIDAVFEVLDIPACLMEKKGLEPLKLH
ncbi:MAG: DUF434 domain-containing protein [Methanosarcinaceae archaeon]|nr:DUF434 domain-containing protein [Methanosarcinaceae archaeon]